jgi:hypothetical protein
LNLTDPKIGDGGKPVYTNGQAGSIYKQVIPLVNACKKPGEWQVYDIIYLAPRFSENSIWSYLFLLWLSGLLSGVLKYKQGVIVSAEQYHFSERSVLNANEIPGFSPVKES